MALVDLLVDLMVDETSFILIVKVEPDLMFGVGGIKGFSERGWTWGDNMFGRYIVE